jgi:predicted transcriptional regulator
MERLTPQEENVMLHVWQLNECAIKDVVERMDFREDSTFFTLTLSQMIPGSLS